MYQLTQLASDLHRQRLAAAEQQHPAQQLLALARTARRAERARRQVRHPLRHAWRLRARPQAQTTSAQ
jgi:hypothetical protein